MVENGRNGRSVAEAMERVSVAVAEALESGVSEEDLQTLFFSSATAGDGAGESEKPEYDPEVVYDELPPGLIDVPTAARQYRLSSWTITKWITLGHLQSRGRLKAQVPHGGYVLVDKAELLEYIVTSRYQPGERTVPDQPIYAELPPGLIDVPAAAKKYDINHGTLRWWVRTGRLKIQGRLRAPCTGGGYSVVDEEELVTYLSAPRRRGPPRKESQSSG